MKLGIVLLTVERFNFDGVLLINSSIYSDDRGLFFESFHQKEWEKLNLPTNFVQENTSVSHANVIRGMHLQLGQDAQAKLVTVTAGSITDVILDLRRDSATFGMWKKFELTASSGQQLYVPRGFAHGFVSHMENTVVHYKCDNFYNPAAESGILYSDNELCIDWGVESPIVSIKDQKLNTFSEYKNDLDNR